MLEALVAERMKPKIHSAIPDIQIGGKSGHSSIEHIVLIKTWMEVNNGSGIPGLRHGEIFRKGDLD